MGANKINIFTTDRTLVGVHDLEVKTLVKESTEELLPLSIAITIRDSCETTALVGNLNILDVTVQKGEDLTVSQTFNILTDTVSDDFTIT